MRLIKSIESNTEVNNQLLPCHTVTKQPPLVNIQMNKNEKIFQSLSVNKLQNKPKKEKQLQLLLVPS